MKDIVFSSFTNDRKPPFQTATLICVENGKKSVEKRALCAQAADHVQSMQAHYKALKQLVCGSDIEVVPCWQEGASLVFEFVQGPTMECRFLNILQHEGEAALFTAIQTLFSGLSSLPHLKDFVATADFEVIFGKMDLSSPCKAYPFSNIDLNFDNLIIKDSSKMIIIDYEWCFNFPVPVSYVFYRALWAFQEKHCLQELQLFKALGFCAEELAVFAKMDEQLNIYIFGSAQFDRCVPGHVFLKKQLQVDVIREQITRTTQELKTALQEVKDLSALAEDREALLKSETNLAAERAVLLENETTLAAERAAWIVKLDADVAELKQAIEQQVQTIEQQAQAIESLNEQLVKKKRFFRR